MSMLPSILAKQLKVINTVCVIHQARMILAD